MNLSPVHQQWLKDRAVSAAVADARGYRSITALQDLTPLGFKQVQLRPGLLLPTHSFAKRGPAFTQLRPDRPRHLKRNGEYKEIKYENPAGAATGLDANPIAWDAIANAKEPLWIVEGIFKADALLSAGAKAVFAIFGVTIWKTLAALQEWDATPLDGRIVYLAHDSDAQTNPQVARQRERLTSLLMARGAVVQHIVLPDKQDGTKQGVDDYLATGKRLQDVLGLATKPVAKPKHTESAGGGTITAQALELVGAVHATPFRETDGVHDYLSFTRAGHVETYSLQSRGFATWLRGLVFRQSGRVLSDVSVREVAAILAMEAGDQKQYQVSLRVMGAPDITVIDRGDPAWSAVEITRDGWKTVPKHRCAFRRTSGMLPLPAPVPVTDWRTTLDRELRPMLNLPKTADAWHLYLSLLTYAIRGRGPFPIYVVNGEQGSAKTTFTKAFCGFVDPQVDAPQSLPREPRDLVIAAYNSYLLAFDNVHLIREWLSDELCRIATGAGTRTRELYTDMEEVRLFIQRPIIINGIEDFEMYSDFADRTFTETLLPMAEQWETDDVFWAQFNAGRPRFLGALYDLVVQAMKAERQLSSKQPHRMAMFHRWYQAVGIARGLKPKEIESAADRNRVRQHEALLEDCPIYMPMKLLPGLRGSGNKGWTGTPTELLVALRDLDPDTAKQKHWPKTPRALSAMLRRYRQALDTRGLRVSMTRVHESKLFHITRISR